MPDTSDGAASSSSPLCIAANGAAPSIARRPLCVAFVELCNASGRRSLLDASRAEPASGPLEYAKLKTAARPYVEAQRVFLATLRARGLGTWLPRPQELDRFTLPFDADASATLSAHTPAEATCTSATPGRETHSM